MEAGTQEKSGRLQQSQTNLTNVIAPAPVSAEEGLNMQETIWDAALLIGLRKGDTLLLTWFQVIVVLVILVINVVVQVALVMAIRSNLAVSSLTSNAKEAVIAQRMANYQNYNNVEASSVETLARRLCNDLAYTQMSQLYDDVSAYLAVEGFTGLNWGRTVAWSAMLIFTLSMITEMYRIFHQGSHVFLLRGSDAGDVRPSARGETNVIFGMRPVKKVFAFALVILPRLLIAAFLTYFGLEFIGSTLSVEDLILNSCALEVVKNFDEFAFKGFATAKLRRVVLRTRFANIRGGREKETDGRARFMGVSYLEFEGVLCGGDADVAWREHPISGMPYFTAIDDSSSEVSALEQFSCFSAAKGDMIRIRAGFPATASSPNQTLIDMIQGNNGICRGEFEVQCPERSLSIISSLDTATELEHYGDGCHNADVHMAMIVQTCNQEQYAQFVPWFQDRRTCGDFAPMCQCDSRNLQGFCEYTNLTRIQENYDISQDWLAILQSVCPVTCNTCQRTSRTPPARRMSDDDAIGLADDGDGGQQMPVPPAFSSPRLVEAPPTVAMRQEGRLARSADLPTHPRSHPNSEPSNLDDSPPDPDPAQPISEPSSLQAWAKELQQQMAAVEHHLAEMMQRNAEMMQRNEGLERRLSLLEASMVQAGRTP